MRQRVLQAGAVGKSFGGAARCVFDSELNARFGQCAGPLRISIGNVADQNGAVVPGATVTITNKGTNQVRESVTNSDGEYTITNVLPGVYDVKVTKQGFNTFTQTDLTITANNITRGDVSMKIGNVNDVVSVTADATVLQTESATVKSEVSSKEIQALPIAAYRNYQSIINLVPGTTTGRFQNAQTDTPEMSLTTNVNGTARNNNNMRLDGATSVNIWLPHHTAYVPPSESIAEVNVSTNNFDAEQGLAGGAAIQVITKSGTNQFHGSAFAYHDNHAFRAKNYFQANQVVSRRTDDRHAEQAQTTGHDSRRHLQRADHEGQTLLLRKLGRPVRRANR